MATVYGINTTSVLVVSFEKAVMDPKDKKEKIYISVQR